jgi:hypothetical protein
MTRPLGLTRKRAGGLIGLTGTLGLAGALLTSQAVSAAGNTDFEGILAAASPTGFTSSPGSYDVSDGPVTVDFVVVARNLTGEAHTIALHFSAHHILTSNGENVADGQPGQPGIAFSGPAGTTQALMPGTQSFTDTWSADGSRTLSLSYTFDACGYYQLDLWAPWKGSEDGRSRATLASGFIRILGCDPAATPTPTPTDGVGGAASTPTPDGGVLGISTSTPSTGSGSGWLTLGAGLLIAGAGLLVVGTGRRRKADEV